MNTTLRQNALILVATDFGAYMYHRLLRSIEYNWHTVHHQNPHQHDAMLNAAMVSGAFCFSISRALKLGCAPVAYWRSVTCIHPLLHMDALSQFPVVSYVKKDMSSITAIHTRTMDHTYHSSTLFSVQRTTLMVTDIVR